MKVLVDTGATNSIINQSSLSKINHQQIYLVQQQFFLANKTSINITGYVTLEIKIQHVKTYVTAAITETLCCDVILGEDWIQYYQVTIDRFDDKIKILGNKASIPIRTSSNNILIPVKLRNSTSIPPHTNQVVEAFVPISQAPKVLFSPDLYFQRRKNMVLKRALIQIRDYVTELIITNLNDFPLYLSRNTNLGFISYLAPDDQIVNEDEIELKKLKESNNGKTFINQLVSSSSIISNDRNYRVADNNHYYKNFTGINYKKGRCHGDADLLSRYSLQNNINQVNNIITRKQQDGHLCPHLVELDGSVGDTQPTATVNVINRSTNTVINNRQNTNGISTSSVNTKGYSTSELGSSLNTNDISTSSVNTNDANGNSDSSLIKNDTNRNAGLSLDMNVNSTLSLANSSAKVLSPRIEVSMKKIKKEQLKDQEIQNKIKNLKNNQDCEVIDGVLHKLVPRGKRKIKLLWIPTSMIEQVIFQYHDHHTAAHLGDYRTTEKLMNKYYWRNMHKMISNYTKSCIKCAKHNVNDMVLLRFVNESSKLQEKHEDPYRIFDQKGPSTVIEKIEDPGGDQNPSYTKQGYYYNYHYYYG